jgi:molybdopterin synthase catalytic subunit
VSGEVTVLYFAAARELCGCERERFLLAGTSASAVELLALVAERHPPFAPYAGRMRLAINGDIAHDAAARVHAGDEIAVLPPVAGGSSGVLLCAVRERALSVDEALGAVTHAGAGAVALFVGCVRDHADGKAVARLDYEAHPSLAEREMNAVLSDVAASHPGVRLAALHRTGQLALGDLAVVVAASAPHRAEAFAACRQAIERIKERVPIWKKEWAPDGSANWVNL